MKKLLLALALLLSGCAQKVQAQNDFVWIEGEKPTATDFPPRHSFMPANAQEADVLSGGAWIGVDGKRDKNLFLEYEVNLPKAGDYQLYARKFWKHGPFQWRIDNGAWHQVTREIALLDDAPIRQFVGANWVGAGDEKIAAGTHTLRIELTEKEGAAAFDAFVLTTAPFSPRGKMKPGEKYNRAPQGWFPFEPDADTFGNSPLDLRYLNEKFAGEHGFIAARGREFVHGNDGQRLRFWGVNVGHEAINWPRATVDNFARVQAKMGVNLVRIHGGVFDKDDATKINEKERDNLFYFVAALKKEGIYSCLSIYFPLWMDMEKTPIKGYKNGQKPFDLIYFNPEFQEIYRNWWRGILTVKNPYTGTTLSDEPAVAMCELVNEESHFFWTFKPYESLPVQQSEMLEDLFAAWLKNKYGSVSNALQKWNANVAGDDAANERAVFMPLWDIFNKRNLRAQDTSAFLAFNQKEFYEKHLAFLKNDLGYKGTIYASNWTTASPQYLGPIDKWTNTAADFMDRHGYFGGPHQGPRAGYSISSGDKYDDRSALFFKNELGEDDFGLPIFDVQNGKPSMISEINWTPPNRFRAEFPLLCAAYGSLQGSDAFIFFADGAPSWDDVLRKFSIQTPTVQGQFPALAFAFRRALIQVAPTVVEAHLPPEELLALKGAPLSASQNFDALRAADVPQGQSAPVEKVAGVDPLTPLVGRVELLFDKGQDRAADLKPFIDKQNKIVKSATGELTWDYGRGAVFCRAPGAQAVTGFLSKLGAIELGDVTVQTPLEYGAISVVALDAQPLSTSQKMLVQVMSEEKNYGWETSSETGLRDIKNIGAAPLVIKNLSGTVAFKRADAGQLKVTPLDFNGYPMHGKTLSAALLTLQPNLLYYLVTK